MTDIAGIDIARLELRLQETFARLMPGSTTEHPITLLNLTPLPDFFYLAVSGQAAQWATLDKESVNLFPNWSDIINLTVMLPAGIPSGTYPLEINASSRTQENVQANITLTLLIGPDQPQQLVVPPAFEQHPDPPFPRGGVQNLQAPPQFNPAAPYIPDYPRLQLDLDMGQLIIACGQTAEQVAHLLNLSAIPQDFTIGLEGLPPQWLSYHPPSLHLSPNWSEAAAIKIDVPLDAVPGRYLMGVKAVPAGHPEATTWTQFDLVILPSAPFNQPPTSMQTGPVFPAGASNEVTNPAPPDAIITINDHNQAEVLPAQTSQLTEVPAQSQVQMPAPALETERFNQPPAQPVNWQTGPFVPQGQPPVQPPVHTPVPAPAPAHENKKESKGGLFGWGKKKKGGCTSGY